MPPEGLDLNDPQAVYTETFRRWSKWQNDLLRVRHILRKYGLRLNLGEMSLNEREEVKKYMNTYHQLPPDLVLS